MKRVFPRFLLPFIILSILGGFLWKGLKLDPYALPSALIGKKVPHFTCTTLEKPETSVTEEIFQGHVSLVNVFASWCFSCNKEHKVWMQLMKEKDGIQIIGLNYHDKRENAKVWLKKLGSPYAIALYDPNGRIGMDFGVTGTPQTFIVDRTGVIRYCHVGPITRELWQKTLLPIIQTIKLREN